MGGECGREGGGQDGVSGGGKWDNCNSIINKYIKKKKKKEQQRRLAWDYFRCDQTFRSTDHGW